MTDDFVIDVTRIRDEARRKMADGPVTDTYGLDPGKVIEVLNDVVATEVVCWLRYTRHAISATGIDRSLGTLDKAISSLREAKAEIPRAREALATLRKNQPKPPVK